MGCKHSEVHTYVYPTNAGKIDNAKEFQCIVNSPMTAIIRITSVLFLGSLFSALYKKIEWDICIVTEVITNGDVVYRAQEALNVS